MTSTTNERYRPPTPRVKSKSLLSSFCSCSRTTYEINGEQPLDEIKPDVQKGFFKRIQCFKGLSSLSQSRKQELCLSLAQKRQSAARKQQLAAAAAAASVPTADRSHSIQENERLLTDLVERESSHVHSLSTYSPVHGSLSTNYSPRRIRNSQSIPLLHRHTDTTQGLPSTAYGIDGAYSFTDIEVASSVHDGVANETPSSPSHLPSASMPIDRRVIDDDQPIGTPKSFASRDFSSAATNLSAYSTQSLLRKLLDKAQVLNDYYNDICHRTSHVQTPLSPSRKRSSSISTNSLLGRTGATPRSLLHRDQSNDSSRRSRRKRPSVYDNMSTDSSRFNLYADEDNVLKELIRFNNDIDLILSRLEMEGESVTPISPLQATESLSTPLMPDETEPENTESKLDDLRNFLQQASVYPSDDSGLAASPPMPER